MLLYVLTSPEEVFSSLYLRNHFLQSVKAHIFNPMKLLIVFSINFIDAVQGIKF